MRGFLCLLALPLLAGCFSTSPNLSPVPLEDGRSEVSPVGGYALNWLIGATGNESIFGLGVFGVAGRQGLSDGRDVGLELLVLPSMNQQQVRVSWRRARSSDAAHPSASFRSVTFVRIDELPMATVGLGRVRAFSWSPNGGVYGGVHAFVAVGKNEPSYYVSANAGAGAGAGVQVGAERRLGQAFVRAEGGVTYVVPWLLQGNGLISAGIRF